MVSRWTKYQGDWGTEYHKWGEALHTVPTLRDVKREAATDQAAWVEVEYNGTVTRYRYRGGTLYAEVA